MKLNRIISILLGAGVLLFASSCAEKLNIPQHSVVPIDDFYSTDTEAEEAIVAAYYQFKTVHSGGTSSASWLLNFLGDELWTGGGNRADGTYFEYCEYVFTDGNGTIKSLYAGLYTLIYRCNLVIERVTGDSEIMKRARAEALTMRAWANFELVTLWGTAPLVDHVLAQDEYLQANSESTTVLWKAIEDDLNEAIGSGALTDKTGTYRITKAYAQALLGKAQLWQEKYSEAAATFDLIINSGKFSLQKDLENFGTIKGDVTEEDLFCMRGIDDASNSGPNSTFRGMWTGLRAEKFEYNFDKTRPATANFATYPFGFQVNPTKKLYDKFVEVEGVDGYRLKNFILTYEDMQDEFNTRVKDGMSIYDCEGYFNRKYMVWKDNGAAYRYPLPLHVMRYDEVLCFAAEAQFQAGNTDKALNYINQLRTRARAPLATSVDMQVIKDESWMELCFEGLRYQNLIRWGDAETLLANRGAIHPELQPDGTVDYVRFQLTKEEMAELVTNCDRFGLLKHSSVCPYALTEQGVAMLSTVLRSTTAVETSIKIMDAFVAMRHFLGDNVQLFRRLETIEYHQLEMKRRQDKTDNRIDEIFNKINKDDIPKQGIFFDGQIYDAYTFVANLIRDAKNSIVLIDNYIDDTVLTLLDKRNNDVTASIYTDRISRNLQLDINRHNTQYPPISVGIYRKAHDRFLIVDNRVYHIGASIKDLGKKIFGFSLMKDLDATDLLNKIGVDGDMTKRNE